MFPLRLGAADDFTIVRGLLERAGFTEPAVAGRLGATLLTQPAIDRVAPPAGAPTDLLDLLIRIFVQGGSVGDGQTEACSTAELDALERLELIVHADRGRLYSPVCLCPVAGVYVVSDRWKSYDGGPLEGSEDIVYPAVVPNTRLFLDLLPDSPCEALLDLCSGSAVAALIGAAKYAVEAHAYDIAARSTHFAEFARRLNGFANVVTGTGDLYEPAQGRTFDRIVAHPPYVPVLESKWIFYSGGDDGEQVTRRIVEQLPAHLRPGGVLYCLAMASDRADAPLEKRVRGWLGSQHAEFDIAVVVRRTVAPEEFALQSAARGEGKDAKEWKQLFETRRITALPYAMIMVQRKAAGRRPFTVRRQADAETSRADHEWLLAWETQAAGDPESVLRMKVKASPHCELQVRYRLSDGEWDAAEHALATSHPFRMQMEIDSWIAHLLTKCDGQKTVSELLEEQIADGFLDPRTRPRGFAELIGTLVSGGFLTAELSARTPAAG